MAMGQKVTGMKAGGAVKNPVVQAKKENGIPKYKAGGAIKGKKC